MSLTFAIIGGGLTGTSMFCQFVKKTALNLDRFNFDADKIKVLIFEKQDNFGPGFPHSDQFVLPYHITNMCAHDMSVMADYPADFQQWTDANLDMVKKHHHWSDDSTCRSVAGQGKSIVVLGPGIGIRPAI